MGMVAGSMRIATTSDETRCPAISSTVDGIYVDRGQYTHERLGKISCASYGHSGESRRCSWDAGASQTRRASRQNGHKRRFDIDGTRVLTA